MCDKIDFAWPVTSEKALVYQYFQSEVARLRNILAECRIVIFGAGIRGCCLLHILEQNGFHKIVFCDNNPEKQGHLIHDYDICSLSDALSYRGRQVFLVSPENSGSMRDQLTDAKLEEGPLICRFTMPMLRNMSDLSAIICWLWGTVPSRISH